jgi:hypothetical protein
MVLRLTPLAISTLLNFITTASARYIDQGKYHKPRVPGSNPKNT